MLALNPILKSHKLLPEASSIAFFAKVADAEKPPATGSDEISSIPVYEVVEGQNTTSEEAAAGSWRGGWASRFVPAEITYESSIQNTETGMISITHAPMGVNSITTWIVREAVEGEGEGLVLEKIGKVSSNRMLMGFIKTTIGDSYERLNKDFVAALEREVSGGQVEKV